MEGETRGKTGEGRGNAYLEEFVGLVVAGDGIETCFGTRLSKEGIREGGDCRGDTADCGGEVIHAGLVIEPKLRKGMGKTARWSKIYGWTDIHGCFEAADLDVTHHVCFADWRQSM